MTDVTIQTLQQKVTELGALIGAPIKLLLVHSQPTPDGTPYVVIGDASFSYVSEERGYELSRLTVNTLDDLLYLIFRRITSQMAGEYEVSHRVAGQDSRRVLFAYQTALMGTLDKQWQARLAEELETVLSSAPYRDV